MRKTKPNHIGKTFTIAIDYGYDGEVPLFSMPTEAEAKEWLRRFNAFRQQCYNSATEKGRKATYMAPSGDLLSSRMELVLQETFLYSWEGAFNRA